MIKLALATLAFGLAYASTPAQAATATCTDFSGSFVQTNGTTQETIVIAQTGCDSITVNFEDGTNEVLSTTGVAETLQTAANGRTLEYIGYFVDHAPSVGATARFHVYITDAVGVLSESQMMTLNLDASTNLVLTNSALSSTTAPQSGTATLVRVVPPTTPPANPPGPVTPPAASKLRATFKKFAH